MQQSYEQKGILYSEILFLLACIEGTPFSRLLESGRARGQSTLLLSLALSEHQLISIERNQDSPDVPVAAERLRDRTNVQLLFGDARKMLPRMVRDGDIVLIDGPKGYRSVRLAIRLLASGKVGAVFVHDLTVGTQERSFIDANFAEARFSDCRDYAETAHLADAGLDGVIPEHQRFGGFTGRFGYGFSLTYLPYKKGRPYRWLLLKARLADLLSRLDRRRASQFGT